MCQVLVDLQHDDGMDLSCFRRDPPKFLPSGYWGDETAEAWSLPLALGQGWGIDYVDVYTHSPHTC
jgi:hypothetical protein